MHACQDRFNDILLCEILLADALYLRKTCGLIGAMVGGVAGEQN